MIKLRIRYVRKINRDTNYYDVGKVWCLNITKKYYYRIVWNNWFFNKRIVIFVLKQDINYNINNG